MSTRLVADLGGTNVRFALVTRSDGTVGEIRSLECRAFPGFADAIEAYLAEKGCEPPQSACFAIAAVETGEQVNITNNHWSFSRHELQARFGFRQLQLINDFTAVAYALPRLQSRQTQELTPGLVADPDNVLAFGPGTGLGGAHLVDRSRVIPCEPGHASLSPGTALEFEIFRQLQAQPREIHAEMLVSGPGLQRLYRALARVLDQAAPELDAAEISDRAVQGADSLCEQTLEIFCALMGSAAGDFAVSSGGYGGLYLAGGIAPQILPLLQKSDFLQRFVHKGAMEERLGQVPVFVILEPNPGLLGAACWPMES
jgi:glucokinase